MRDTDLAAEAAAQMLADRGIPATFEPFGPLIFIEDDGAHWTFGTNDETWGADLMRDAAVGDTFGCCVTDVPSDSTDPFAIANAIIAALTRQVGVELWTEEG